MASKGLGALSLQCGFIYQIPPISDPPNGWFDIQGFGTFLIMKPQFRTHNKLNNDYVPSL